MSSVHDDLATLRHALTSFAFNQDETLQSLARVEAETARLERELASERGQGPLTSREREHLARAEAAEAEVARLRDGLRNLAEIERPADLMRQIARALLGDQDGAA